METADGADKTFSSHLAGTADRGRRVRLPAIEGFRGKGVLRPFGYGTSRIALD
jgi:hypothetical protein